jgi:MFS family permease
MRSLVDAIAPARFGSQFRLLLASSWLSNTGDGMAVAAGPLLVASMTHDAFLIASGAFLQWLAPLVFGLPAGALSDRVNRKLIVVTADLLRVGLLAALSLAIALKTSSVALVLIALFLLGVAEVFGDNTTSTLLPMLVDRDDLAIANARIGLGFITVNQLAGPPIGAVLFSIGRAWPFLGQAVLVASGVLMVSRIALPRPAVAVRGETTVRRDIADAFSWVRHHPAVRTLVLTIFVFNITFGAAWSVLVLYATRRLDLGSLGFGLIATVSAAGGLFGTSSYGWIIRRLSLGNIMRVGLIIETLTHFGLALATTPWIALPIFFVFGAHAFVWNTTSVTVRQRSVPVEMQGRVGSVNTLGVFGGLVIGSVIGGALAQTFGITAPFWFAFAGSAMFLGLIWRQLSHITSDAPVRPARTS